MYLADDVVLQKRVFIPALAAAATGIAVQKENEARDKKNSFLTLSHTDDNIPTTRTPRKFPRTTVVLTIRQSRNRVT